MATPWGLETKDILIPCVPIDTLVTSEINCVHMYVLLAFHRFYPGVGGAGERM